MENLHLDPIRSKRELRLNNGFFLELYNRHLLQVGGYEWDFSQQLSGLRYRSTIMNLVYHLDPEYLGTVLDNFVTFSFEENVSIRLHRSDDPMWCTVDVFKIDEDGEPESLSLLEEREIIVAALTKAEKHQISRRIDGYIIYPLHLNPTKIRWAYFHDEIWIYEPIGIMKEIQNKFPETTLREAKETYQLVSSLRFASSYRMF